MLESVTIPVGKLAYLQERAKKLAREKSYMQLVIRLMNRVSAASGLEDTIDCMLRNILDVVGGTDLVLYYWIDNDIFRADVFGNKIQLDAIDDELVQQAQATHEPVEFECAFSETQLTTPEFTKGFTWVYPLLIGQDLIGVLKMESLHIGMREMEERLPTFFNHAALVLKNAILGHSRLQQSIDQISRMNEQLQLEIAEREMTEEALRQTQNELEHQVAERTAELQATNEMLQQELDERKMTQEELRRYSEEVRDLYNNAPCGYHSLDKDGAFVRINDTELRLLGFTRDEILGKKFTDFITASSLQTFRDHFPRFMAKGAVRDLEFEMVRKDGTIFPALLSATAIYDESGTFVMSRSTIFDITERKKIEEKEHLLSAIVQSSDDAIIAKDLNGVILTWNRGAERIYDYSAAEAIGQSVSMLYPPGQEVEFSRIMTALKQGKPIEHVTTVRQRKDGQRISISLTVSPITDMNGTIVGASTIARDITEQIQAEEQISRLNKELEERVETRTIDLESKRSELEESQLALMNIVEDLNLKTAELEDANTKLLELDRLKSMFIASMSHELRTPLNSIIGFSSIIRDGWLGPVNQEQKENLDTIQRAGKHLLSLINDVIDVSKIEAGRIEARFEEFDLYDLLTEAVQYVEKDICEKGMELNLQLQHQLLRTDKRRLLQCIINLLSNAVKFTERGAITVSSAGTVSHPDDGRAGEQPNSSAPVSITISDTGIGIDAEDIPTIFEPFVRLESHLKTVAPGTGLGLYLTRKLVVEVLGGDILCTSSLGMGSTFTLTIPERIYEKGTGSRG